MVDVAHLCQEAIRLHPIDPDAAKLLQAAGDEIQQLRAQRDALSESLLSAQQRAGGVHG